MEKPERLIGRKVRGFKFESNQNVGYSKLLDNQIGKVGVIKKIYDDNTVRVLFEGIINFYYPADQIEDHLVVDEIQTFTKEDLRTAYKIGFDIGIFNKKISSDKSFEEWFDKKTKEEQLTVILGSSEKVSEIMELFKN